MTGAGGVSGSGSGSGSAVSAVDSVVVCVVVLIVVVGRRLAATAGRADVERVAVVDVEPRATTDAACVSNANNAITAAHITPPCMNVF